MKSKDTKPRPPQRSITESALLQASFISTMWKERNPFVLVIQELKRQIHVIRNLKQNLRASKALVNQLQQQAEKMDTLAHEGRANRTGENLNLFK
ncbi:MAG: hypothetical protein K2X66_12185 [Cyanobacteria bacterium]|nr:hypothetical protein [Cyanobacteriota bacterium]